MRQFEQTAIAVVAAMFLAAAAHGQAVGDGAVSRGDAAGTGGIRYVEVDDDRLTVPGIELRVDQIDDMKVVARDGETIGEVEDVLATPDGRIAAIVVETDGFLGLGGRDVILALADVTLRDGRLHTGIVADAFKDLPEWN